MKIVIANTYLLDLDDVSWNGLNHYGEVKILSKGEISPTEDDLIAALDGVEVAILHQSKVTRRLLEQCQTLRFISITSTGYDLITDDTKRFAKDKGVIISYVAGYGVESVSQHAIAFLLEWSDKIAMLNQDVHQGKWKVLSEFKHTGTRHLMELSGRTLGIIGFGSIGRNTAKIAKALDMKILACDSNPCQAGRDLADYVDLDTLLRRSDFISLHCPWTTETNEIINANTIKKMKKGAFLINTARGKLVNEKDLADALNTGKLGGAGVDVVSTEPINMSNPLFTAKNCLITPHSSWMASETRQKLVDCIVNNVKAYCEGHPQAVVNP